MFKKILFASFLFVTIGIQAMEPEQPASPITRPLYYAPMKEYHAKPIPTLAELAAKAASNFLHSHKVPASQKEAFKEKSQFIPAEVFPLLLTTTTPALSPLAQELIQSLPPQKRVEKWEKTRSVRRNLMFEFDQADEKQTDEKK